MFLVVSSRDPDRLERVMLEWGDESEDLSAGAVRWNDGGLGVRFASHGFASCAWSGDLLACGFARLDDVQEMVQLAGSGEYGSELELILALYSEYGRSVLSSLRGTFAFIIRHSATDTTLLVRDPFGLAPLFIRQTDPATFQLSDMPDALADGTVDGVFAAYFMATGRHAPGRTIWQGVEPVPAGTITEIAGGVRSEHRYWTPLAGDGACSVGLLEAAEELRRLVLKAVPQYVERGGRTWAELSGGLDSSSVVSAAAVCGRADPGRVLGGTITFVDGIGIDETPFVDAVIARHGVVNRRFVRPWPWRDDGEPPWPTPQPARDYPFYARDRAVARVLQQAGASTLLSGVGPDHYLPLGTAHIADLFWRGELRRGVDQLTAWAGGVNSTIWHALIREVLVPLSPASLQQHYFRRESPKPTWFRADFVEKSGLAEHAIARQIHRGGRGRRRLARFEHSFNELAAGIGSWRTIPGCEVRHPLLYRPLVDFCLSLPDDLRNDVRRSKAVLRVAMGGILPDLIVNRTAKGSVITPRVCWALKHERDRLTKMARASILADLGYIEPSRLVEAIETCGGGDAGNEFVQTLYCTLSLETWLTARAGRLDSCAEGTVPRANQGRGEVVRSPGEATGGHMRRPEATS